MLRPSVKGSAPAPPLHSCPSLILIDRRRGLVWVLVLSSVPVEPCAIGKAVGKRIVSRLGHHPAFRGGIPEGLPRELVGEEGVDYGSHEVIHHRRVAPVESCAAYASFHPLEGAECVSGWHDIEVQVRCK